MALKKALVALCLGSAAAFNPRAKAQVKAASKQLAAGVLAVAAALPVAPALAADSLVLGTPLEEKLAAFGAASYPVVNSITDAGALADKFIEFIDAKVKPADASAGVNKAVDGLLAIPDGKVSEYAGVLKQVVYKGVSPSSCVTLGGSEAFAQKLQNSAAVKSVPSSKIDDLQKKFKPANSAVPVGRAASACPAPSRPPRSGSRRPGSRSPCRRGRGPRLRHQDRRRPGHAVLHRHARPRRRGRLLEVG